jgi:hypothetical protein
MPPQSVAGLAGRHGLGAGGAFGAARSQVQDGLAPMANPLPYQGVNRVNLHPLRAPAEDAVGGRVTPSNDIDPKGFFHERLQQVGVNVQAVLLGALAHAVQRAFNLFGNGGDLHARVRAKDRNGLLALLGGDGQYGVENQRRQHGAVFATAKTHQPGTVVFQVKLLERSFYFLKHPCSCRGEYAPPKLFL